MSITAIRVAGLAALVLLSGFAGLGYETVWARMLSVALGHEIMAVLAVIAAFFSGLALGAAAFDRSISRSARPALWYAGFEFAIALWSLLLIILIPWANALVPQIIGVAPSPLFHWAVAFGVPFCLLLPATAAMGGTLPAMERLVTRVRGGGWTVGGLYAANTFGAVAGILMTTGLIAPHLGFRSTLLLLAMVNMMCAAGALVLCPAVNAGIKGGSAQSTAMPVRRVDDLAAADRVLAILFLTGFLGIGYEVLVVRMLSQVLDNTVYTFAAVLAVYLFGTAAGAGFYQLAQPRRYAFRPVLAALLAATATSCLIGLWALSHTPSITRIVATWNSGGVAVPVLAEILAATIVFLLPTVAMGATFSHLAQRYCDERGGFGRALAANTLGGALAPVMFGVVALPSLGAETALVLCAVGYCLLVAAFPPREGPPIRHLVAAAPVLGAAALLVSDPTLRLITFPPGGAVVEHIDGVMASVSVVRDARNELHLKVNNHYRMGGTASRLSDRRQAFLPLILHPRPESALFLGLGTGATYLAARVHPGLTAHGVELVPEVIDVMPAFGSVPGLDDKGRDGGPLAREDRVWAVFQADARRFVRAAPWLYDVIVADLFHPGRDGAGSLYTVEHFAAVRERLRPGGLFCQWLPLHQLDLETLRLIVRTFVAVYPDAHAILAHFSLQTPLIGLVGGLPESRPEIDAPFRRIAARALAEEAQAIRLEGMLDVPGLMLAGPAALSTFAGHGPVNTDDQPLVTFRALHVLRAERSSAASRLAILLDQLQPQADDLFRRSDRADGLRDRLTAFWHARNAFLRAGIGLSDTGDIRQLVARLARPLLAAVRLSPDFEAAYTPLLMMARDLYRRDVTAGRNLLLALHDANPRRPDAKRLLLQLSEEGQGPLSHTDVRGGGPSGK